MRIGIDLDGVIFDSELDYRIYSELYDFLELNQNSIRDNNELRFQDRFNWTEEQMKEFFEIFNVKVVKEANFMPGAKQVLKMLKDDGHELVLITARGGLHKIVIDITKDRLKDAGLDIFDRYYWAVETKDDICVNEEIDIMIDDYYKNCQSISNRGVKTIYFKDAESKDIEENENLKVLYNWGEIYRYIKEQEKSN